MSKQYKVRAWLSRKYWADKLSLSQIADICGVSSVTICNWMIKLGIPRRTSAQAARMRSMYTEWGRVCCTCNTYKPWGEFHRELGLPMGRKRYCKDCHKERERERHAADPEDIRAKRRMWEHQRRACKAAAPGSLTQADMDLVYEVYGARCLNCGATENLAIDHVVPLSKGGAHHISNIQILCCSCNSSKRSKTIDYRPPTNSWWREALPL